MSDAHALGFFLAIIGSLSFGTYILPRKLSTLSVIEYQYWVALAIAPLCVLTALLFRAPLAVPTDLMLYALLCGPIWTLGSLSYSSAVDRIGVARSTPVKNMAPVFAAFYGIFLFNEYTLLEPIPLAMALGGVFLMVGAAYFIGNVGAPEHETAVAFDRKRTAALRSKALRFGWFFSLSAAFFYGLYAIPLKHVLQNEMNPYSACAWLGVGVFISSAATYAVLNKRLIPPLPNRRQFLLAQSAGAIWTTGQITGTVAMIHIAMSISWPVTNLSTLFAVAWGVWVFREVQLDRHLKEVVFGLLLYAAGLVLLAFAAPSGHV
ncbi:MAG: hypothetical protein IH851_12745 [Armatimonadetes bacterium]|nr:hypothetical protein [Armatimonadota bacterium]